MNNDNKNMKEILEAKFDELFSDLYDELPDPDDELDTIILDDENGNKIEFEFMDLIAFEGEEYAVLLPADDCDNAWNAVILKLKDEYDENENFYENVDDEEILTEVFNIFKDNFKDEFIFDA